jgi:hypothetical protein
MSLTAEHTSSQIRIFRGGVTGPLIVQTAEPDCRPFVHPVSCPDGVGSFTEDRPPHHPWQRGLYVGLNDVNGTGFWLGETSDAETNGTFHPEALQKPSIDGNLATWTVETEWRSRAGERLLLESQGWRFEDLGDRHELSLRWALTALTDVTVGEYPYGGLFLRMPWRAEVGGEVLTSEGARSTSEAEGRRARWVAISVPIPRRNGELGTVAILDHADNAEHPIPWRVDDGFGISPSRSILGSWLLPAEATSVNQYRLLFGLGGIDADAIETSFERFATSYTIDTANR